ncbi:MAG: arylsulfatase [Candidatus Hydrogenedentes bacterium]|nr:arylsulfatase [Candidatus Hydrogenedentota bacterium]
MLAALAATGTFLAGGLPAAASEPKRPPNIVFILADDLGYGALGCYGQEQIKTPRLDAMAKEGMRFTQAYSGSTVCAPSRCSLMTGMHQGHAFIRGNTSMIDRVRVPLRPEDGTVAELLQEAGYKTGIIGKWGLGDAGTVGAPNAKGFDEFFGYIDQYLAHNYYPERLWRNEEEITLAGNELEIANVCKRCESYSHDLFTEEALDFVTRHKEDAFFLYLAYTLPHANNEAVRLREHGMEIPSDEPYSDEAWPAAQRSHAAMISRLDRDVGRMLDRLGELGIAEDTLVIFASDNGPHREGGADPEFFNDNGPFRGIKRDLYEGGIRVPAIAWWPGSIAANTVSDHAWAFWDFLPTAAALAGRDAPACDGISFAPTLLGHPEKQVNHDYLYWEFHEGAFKQAVRMGEWKAICNKAGTPTELYNLSKDPSESKDVAKRYPALVEKAESIFRNGRTESPYWPSQR